MSALEDTIRQLATYAAIAVGGWIAFALITGRFATWNEQRKLRNERQAILDKRKQLYDRVWVSRRDILQNIADVINRRALGVDDNTRHILLLFLMYIYRDLRVFNPPFPTVDTVTEEEIHTFENDIAAWSTEGVRALVTERMERIIVEFLPLYNTSKQSVVDNPFHTLSHKTFPPYTLEQVLDLAISIRKTNQVIPFRYATPYNDISNALTNYYALKDSQRDKLSTEDVARHIFGGTDLAPLILTEQTVQTPTHVRFEHHWIVGGSGHGKTQALQAMILEDIAHIPNRSVIVIDSQGGVIPKLARLACFAPGGSLDGRLVHIDPVSMNLALNLFNVGHTDKRAFNNLLATFRFIINSVLQSSEFTGKQALIFDMVMILMVRIPNATIHTFHDILAQRKNSTKYQEYIAQLPPTPHRFFTTEYFSEQYDGTRGEVSRRLWQILADTTFDTMFSHPETKINLGEEIAAGKLILISTDKQHLADNSAIFGSFFVGLVYQAIMERMGKHNPKPCFVYIDECHEYLKYNIDAIATLLDQARKTNTGLILAHQHLGHKQLPAALASSFTSNTSIKMVGGVDPGDAHTLAPNLRTTPEFIRAQPKGTFATFIKGVTPSAVPIRFPFGFLENQPRMTNDQWREVQDRMKARYGTDGLTIAPAPAPPIDLDNAEL